MSLKWISEQVKLDIYYIDYLNYIKCEAGSTLYV